MTDTEPQFGRRWSDNMPDATSEEIRRMILQSGSDEQRAMLLILQQLSDSVVRSNEAWAQLATGFRVHQDRFEAHLQTFEQHAEEEMKLINKGIGGWRAIAIIGPIAIGLISYFGQSSINASLQLLTKETMTNEAQEARISELRTALDVLKSKVDQNTLLINQRVIGIGPLGSQVREQR